MNDTGHKQIEQSRMSLVNATTKALERLQKGDFTPTLLTFWGSKGMGKTTLLTSIRQNLGERHPSLPIQFLDVDGLALDEIRVALSNEVAGIEAKGIRVILLDNIDELLRRSMEGEAFFEFERGIILPLIESADTLIIASSQIELNQWRDEDVRMRQVNIQIPVLEKEEVTSMANRAGVDAIRMYELTFGQPKIVGWLLNNPQMDEREIANNASVYFLEGIPNEARQIAEIICLLPIFNAYLLKKILNRDSSRKEVQYLQCLEWLKEYIRRGLVYWDVTIGSYRFTDSAVRCLLARGVSYEEPDIFRQVQQIASEYFQAEARSPGYLHMHLVSAVYHMAQTMQSDSKEEIGNKCLTWVKSNMKSWSSAPWSEVVLAWESGAGEKSVREELVHMIGHQTFKAIAHEIEISRQMVEAIK